MVDSHKISGEDKSIMICVIVVATLIAGLIAAAIVFSHFGDMDRQRITRAKIHACEKAPNIKECIVIVAPPN